MSLTLYYLLYQIDLWQFVICWWAFNASKLEFIKCFAFLASEASVRMKINFI